MSHETPSDVTIKQMEELCEKGFALQLKVDEAEDKVKEMKEELHLIQAQIQNYLEHFNLKKWSGARGNIELRERSSVRIPSTREDKELLFNFLKSSAPDENLYWNCVNINSQKLNSLYNEKKELDPTFTMPGIGESTIYKQTILKPKR